MEGINHYKLKNRFSHYANEVETYIDYVCEKTADYYYNYYSKHPELTSDFNQDLNVLIHSLRFLEDYLYYYDQFYPNDFPKIFHNLQEKLDVITVLPSSYRGVYGRFDEVNKTVFINPALSASSSLTGLERTRLYMCHELGHIINSDWMNCVENQILKSGEKGEALQLMYDGFSLIDEATTQNRAEAITYYFSNKQRRDLMNYQSRLFDGNAFRSNFDYYKELQEPAITFSKTLRGSGGKRASDDDAMRILSVRTLDSEFVDKVFYEYEKDGHLSDLYKLLAYLGVIKNASYAAFGMGEKHFIRESGLAKNRFVEMATPLFDSRLPYHY